MLIGYARVSSDAQDTTLQRVALNAAGVGRLFVEKRSAGAARPLLASMLYCLRRGDVVVVYKLDRLARSVSHLLAIIDRLDKLGAGLRSLTEPIDTTTPVGRMILQVLGSVAEFERALIRERSMAGQDAAHAAGVRFGRRRAVSALDESDAVRLVLGGLSLREVGSRLGVHHCTVRRMVLRVTDPGHIDVRSSWRLGLPRSRKRAAWRLLELTAVALSNGHD